MGRYLTGTVGYDERPKNMTRTELAAIFTAGLRVFPIFQEGIPNLTAIPMKKAMKMQRKLCRRQEALAFHLTKLFTLLLITM